MKKTGKNLERLVRIVEEIYRIDSSTQIYSNYRVENTSGNNREIDILIKSNVNNFEIIIAIECKEYKSKISVDKIEAFNSKCLRIPEINKKIFVSENGFQKDAIDCAKSFGIELYTFNYLKDNVRKILIETVQQIKPRFKGFEVLKLYCDDNSFIKEVSAKDVKTYFSINQNEEFSLYQLIKLAAKPNWSQISSMAFLQWLKTQALSQHIHFFVNLSGIYFEINKEKIFVHKIECIANIDFEFIDVQSDEMEYKKVIDNTTKANILNFKCEENIKGQIVKDNNENLHFFDNTDETNIKKLDVLFSYNPKTDEFTHYN